MEKFLGLLGLCARAGRLVSGEDAVRLSLKRSQARMVIADAQSSANTLEKATSACGHYNVKLLVIDADIGNAIGKEGRRLIAVTDKSFAKNLLDIYNNLADTAE